MYSTHTHPPNSSHSFPRVLTPMTSATTLSHTTVLTHSVTTHMSSLCAHSLTQVISLSSLCTHGATTLTHCNPHTHHSLPWCPPTTKSSHPCHPCVFTPLLTSRLLSVNTLPWCRTTTNCAHTMLSHTNPCAPSHFISPHSHS